MMRSWAFVESLLTGLCAGRTSLNPLRRLSGRTQHQQQQPNKGSLESRLADLREDTAKFHESYWTAQNNAFNRERTQFIARLLTDKYPDEIEKKKTLSSKEMSVFYRSFLSARRSEHLSYNREWQARNLRLILLSAGVFFERAFGRGGLGRQ